MESWLNDGADVAVSPHDPNVVFTTGNYYFNSAYWTGVTFTTDGGTTWRRDTLDSLSRGHCIAFDPVDSLRVYLGADSGYSYRRLYVTTDRGGSWQTADAGLAGWVNCIAPRPDDPATILAGTSSGLYRSTNTGAGWAQVRTGETRAVVWDRQDPGTAYAATATGVHRSTDGGAGWSAYNDGLANTNVLSLAIEPGPRLYAGTSGGSVYATDPVVGITAPAVPRGPQAGLGLTPNPASDRIRVASSLLPATGCIYDPSGRRLLTQEIPAGGSIDVRALPAGAYFICLRSGDITRRAPFRIVR
jgi:hypothetical protein